MLHSRALLDMGRRLLLIAWILLLFPVLIVGQAPDSLSFQGYLTNTGGTPLNTTVPMTFKLYKSGVKVWEQTHASVAVLNGRFDVLLGGTGTTSLDTVAFNEPIDLGIAVGGDPEITPRTPLAASAFALGLRGLYTFKAKRDGADIESLNLVAGAPGNYLGTDVVGATISGGGGLTNGEVRPNRVLGDWGLVGGGRDNTSAGSGSVVGGGIGNSATATSASVPGGYMNAARGSYAFAAGYKARANQNGTFVWNDRSVTTGNDSLVSTAENQFLIRAAGGVGIGTNSPANQLSVYGHADVSGNLGIGTDAPAAQIHAVKSDGSAKGLKLESVEGDRASFYYVIDQGLVIDSYRPKDARRLDLFFQPNGGNVGIGTLSPGYLLEVDGDAAKPGGGSWTVASDERLKDVEAPFDRGLDALRALHPVSYRYKKDNPRGLPSDQTYVGLVAQVVEEVIPEAVDRDDAGYLHLNNDPIIWTMLNAINDLREENERQRVQIDRLLRVLGEPG